MAPHYDVSQVATEILLNERARAMAMDVTVIQQVQEQAWVRAADATLHMVRAGMVVPRDAQWVVEAGGRVTVADGQGQHMEIAQSGAVPVEASNAACV